MITLLSQPELVFKFNVAASFTEDKEITLLKNDIVKRHLRKKGFILLDVLEGESAYYAFYAPEKNIANNRVRISNISISLLFKQALLEKAASRRDRYVEKAIKLNELIENI